MKWECKKVIYEFEDGTVVDAEDFVKTDEQEKKAITAFCNALGYDKVTFAE